MRIKKLRAGKKLVEFIRQCVLADQPLLLIGAHGVGKSQLFGQAAVALGIGYISRDLSVMEPSDLIGMPYIDAEHRTRFAPPGFLPRDGRGLLVIEELNRAPRYMLAPCFQLLTERSLNDYFLPSGWVPMAAVNPQGEEYDVGDLDPALLARFVQVRVEADATEWGVWARNSGDVHPGIIDFVEQSSGIFDPGATNPRAWTYLSQQMRAWEASGGDPELLEVSAAGLVGETWATAFLQSLNNGHTPLTAKEIVGRYQGRRAAFLDWIRDGRLDLARASISPLKRYLGQKRYYESIVKNETKVENVRRFVDDLPADLSREMKNWLKAKGYDPLLQIDA